MFNTTVFRNCLDKYEAGFAERWPDENYKWIAIKCFQDHWDIEAEDFYQMFTDATAETYNLLVSFLIWDDNPDKDYLVAKLDEYCSAMLELMP